MTLFNSQLQEEIQKKEITTQGLINDSNNLKRKLEDLENILKEKKTHYKEKFKNPNSMLYDEASRLRE